PDALPIFLPALPLEDDDLLALAVRDDLALNGCALDGRASHADLAVGLRQQDLVERHRLADLRGERRDPDRLAGLGPELLSAGADDRVHGSSRCIQSTDIERSPARGAVSSPAAGRADGGRGRAAAQPRAKRAVMSVSAGPARSRNSS